MHTRPSLAALCVSVSLALLLFGPAPGHAQEFRAFFYHTHTIYSTDNPGWEPFKPSVAEVISKADQVASDMGMEGAVAITDHRTIEAYFDPEFVPIGVAQPIKGEEWGGDGHAGALNFTGDVRITEYSGPDRYTEMVTETHARGGIVIANHPRDGDWKTDRRLGVDGIEVWSVSLWGPPDEVALAWWQRLLAAGERVAAVGGSDAHFIFLPIETPVNLVSCPSNDPDDVVAGVRDGRSVIAASPVAARVFLGADTDGNGQYDDASVGDVVPVAGSTVTDFEAVVEGAVATDRLILVDRDGVFHDGLVGDGPGWTGDAFRFTRAYTADSRDFVRAELRDDSNYPYCLTNPIYAVGTAAPSGTEGEIRGTVTDSDGGAPLAGATVTITPGEYSTATTDANGDYAVVVPNGTYTVKASLDGYVNASVTDVAVASGVETIDLALSAAPTCGTVPRPLTGRRDQWQSAFGYLLPLAGILLFTRWRRRHAARLVAVADGLAARGGDRVRR